MWNIAQLAFPRLGRVLCFNFSPKNAAVTVIDAQAVTQE